MALDASGSFLREGVAQRMGLDDVVTPRDLQQQMGIRVDAGPTFGK